MALVYKELPSLTLEEVRLVAQDHYHTRCIELGDQPKLEAFNGPVEVAVTNMNHLTEIEGWAVCWAEETDSEHLIIRFRCPVTGAESYFTQHMNYTAPMDYECVRLWIEHTLITLVELLIVQQIHEQIEQLNADARERRSMITKLIHAKAKNNHGTSAAC